MREKDYNLFTYENWRDIAGYEGFYQVSTWGRVRSLDRWVWNALKQAYSLRKGKILKAQLNKDGYQRVGLLKDRKRKHYYVHRLVAQAFIPNLQNFKEVNHLNECKDDNRVRNLEWCDRLYNNNFGTHNERIAKANTNGIRSKRVAQINPQTNEIIRIWPSTNEGGRNGFNCGHISHCCRGKRKTHHGFKWQYIE